MTVSVKSIGYWAVAGLALVTSVRPEETRDHHEHGIQPRDKVDLRLMLLGASITLGYKSSHGNGYRKALYDLLEEDGYSVDMVGTRRNGTMEDDEHEGWIGLRVRQILQKAELSVPDRRPNLFTVNAGTNDCLQDADTDHVGDRMGVLLNCLWEASPAATVVLSTLIYNDEPEVEDCVRQVNEQYVALADKMQAQSKKVVLVDMHTSEGPQKSDMADDTHPEDEGYEKMAQLWLRGIRDAAQREWLHTPIPIDDGADAQPSKALPDEILATAVTTASLRATLTDDDDQGLQPTAGDSSPAPLQGDSKSASARSIDYSSRFLTFLVVLRLSYSFVSYLTRRMSKGGSKP